MTDCHQGGLTTPLHALEHGAGTEIIGRATIDRKHEVVPLETGLRRHTTGRRRGDPPPVAFSCAITHSPA